MTEIQESTENPLPLAVRRFVAHWGSMGDHWGVNRSVSQVHALLYLSEKPLTAEDIAAALGMARSKMLALPRPQVTALMKMGSGIARFLGRGVGVAKRRAAG